MEKNNKLNSHARRQSSSSVTRKSKRGNSSDHLTPTYNLKAVVNETGLKPDTFRAWERRYGLPNPHRTAGGHRLYSQRDIDLLKWLVNQQKEGLSISRAVDLWNQIEADGRDPLSEYQAKHSANEELAPSPTVIRTGDNLSGLRQSWIEACLDFDERRADSILADAFALFPTETVCFSLLQKGLYEIGVGWYEKRISIQQEHFASALAIRRLETMVASTPAPTRKGRILAVCPAEERHTFSLLLITLLLRRGGWDVVYLGANVPTERLEPTLYQTKPDLVILAAQTLNTAKTSLEMLQLLQKARVATAYGGAIFNHLPDLRNMMPGYFLGEQIEHVAHMVEKLLTNPPPVPAYEQVPDAYKIAREHFMERQAQIEAELWESMEEFPFRQYLKNANKELAQNIIAALTFGNMHLMQANVEWVRGLLVNYHFRMPDNILQAYIEQYSKIANKLLDDRGAVIKLWLQDFEID